jgi:hypothetical protein
VEIVFLQLSEKEAVYLAPEYGGRRSTSGQLNEELTIWIVEATHDSRVEDGLADGGEELTHAAAGKTPEYLRPAALALP